MFLKIWFFLCLMKNKVLIVGTGYLGRTVVKSFKERGQDTFSTHNNNQFFSDSLHYDFFRDDFKDIVKGVQPEIIVFTAKVEFSEDENVLKNSMANFLDSC